jgi:hypothetical protein
MSRQASAVCKLVCACCIMFYFCVQPASDITCRLSVGCCCFCSSGQAEFGSCSELVGFSGLKVGGCERTAAEQGWLNSADQTQCRSKSERDGAGVYANEGEPHQKHLQENDLELLGQPEVIFAGISVISRSTPTGGTQQLENWA